MDGRIIEIMTKVYYCNATIIVKLYRLLITQHLLTYDGLQLGVGLRGREFFLQLTLKSFRRGKVF